ncbi:MAG: hypothetical protein CYPHOPRED_001648 [Cyphobasidiales sp. Tagirdzhanova-0007]|nr:MAG: hypothetical protein CYPHOPRED_001648 [Cyphobasidiales sp. Tagirdzhanova-0007]
MRSSLYLLPFLWLAVRADVITDIKEGMVENGKASGVRKLSLLGDTDNKLISTSFVSINQCPDEFALGSPCVTFKLAKEGQLDDMSDHPGATKRQRNFIASPDLDSGSSTVSWNMMVEQASAQPGFFHLAQIIGGGGPSWTMSIFQQDQGDMVAIVDASLPEDDKDYVCDSMNLSKFMSAPMGISVSIDIDSQSLHWAVTNLVTKKTVMICHRDGDASLSKGSNIQGGAYRRVLNDGTTPAVVDVGGFKVTNSQPARLAK